MSNIIEITDFLDPALDVYARLTENQLLNRENPENLGFDRYGRILVNLSEILESGANRFRGSGRKGVRP